MEKIHPNFLIVGAMKAGSTTLMNYLRVWFPLSLLTLLIIVFFFGLEKDPSLIPSVRINKKAPEFNLQSLTQNLSKTNEDKPYRNVHQKKNDY